MEGIGGIGGIGAGIGGTLAAGAVSPAMGASATIAAAPVGLASVDPAAMSGMTGALPAGIQQLAEYLRDFSSAEILIALMMAGGGGGRKPSGCRHNEDSNAALALLAGMMIGSRMGSLSSPCSTQMTPAAGGATGGGLNMTV